MRQLRLLRRSLVALVRRPLRSLLCIAGSALGIAAVFVACALGAGAQAEVLRSLDSLGTGLLVVRPALTRKTTARKEIQGLVTTLKLEDSQAIAALDGVAEAAPALEGMFKVRSDRQMVVTKVIGTTVAFFHVRSYQLDRGRLFEEQEERSARRIVVLGARVADLLYAGTDPLGQTLRIQGAPFEIVGTVRSKGVSDDGADNDNQVYIPILTAQRRVFNSHSLSTLFVGMRGPDQVLGGEERIRQLLRGRHRLERHDRADDFAIQNQLKLIKAQQQAASSMMWVATGLAGLALLLGGTGILALQLMSVRERTSEIGLRMAFGARQADILYQFLAEAVALSFLGGLLGLGAGLVGVRVVCAISSWPVQVSSAIALQSLGAACVLGLASGVVPAMRAARLPPVEALAAE